MNNWTVRITFLEPYRVIEWKKKEDRNEDPDYLRGGTFARWHKTIKGKDLGRPYITGTLVRSALFTELQNIRTMLSDDESYKNFVCNGIDISCEKFKPKFLSRRFYYDTGMEAKDTEGESTWCGKCPLCIIMGRVDNEDREKKRKEKDPSLYSVHFSNFEEFDYKTGTGKRKFNWHETAGSRIVNRVDQFTGKARDYMKIWEIEPNIFRYFNGEITFNIRSEFTDRDPEIYEKIQSYMAAGLARINLLAGALCRVDIVDGGDHDSLIHSFFNINDTIKAFEPDFDDKEIPPLSAMPDFKQIAAAVTNMYETSQQYDKTRRLADAIRELRRFNSDIIDDLPKAKGDNKKNKTDWDMDIPDKNITLRQYLKSSSEGVKGKEWRFFCEDFGKALYDAAKSVRPKADIITRTQALPRLLGQTEYHGTPLKKSEDNTAESMLGPAYPRYVWLIDSFLKAETPFFFGYESSGDQTGFSILLTKDGRFRLPRTVLRGILRRDIQQVLGDQCKAPVGGPPCQCSVCRTMAHIMIADSQSICDLPPHIRYRIRINPHTQTVEHGALFDMETGFQGIRFPFRMYIQSFESEPDSHVMAVLARWADGKAFMGGNSSTGMGCFSLGPAYCLSYDIEDKDIHLKYLLARGFKGIKINDIMRITDKEEDKEDYFCQEPEDYTLEPKKILSDFPWQKDSYEMKIVSPLISRDPIGAMLDSRCPDTVMIQKTILDYSKNPKSPKKQSVYFIKAETIKGALRNIVSKNKDPKTDKYIFELDHEDCNCIQCRLFGSVHQQGKLRFEDGELYDSGSNRLKPDKDKPKDKLMDHVAIDRFTGGSMDKMKFNEYPLCATPESPLIMKSCIWIHKDINGEDREVLGRAFAEFSTFNNIGGLDAIGYGRINGFKQKPEWIPDLYKSVSDMPNQVNRIKIEKADPSSKLEPGKFYYPHVFIRPPENKKVSRTTQLISHAGDNKEKLYSGVIRCSLETLGPIFIPDTDTKNDNYFQIQQANTQTEKHKNFGFFRIGSKIAIPGSSIRGVISSVYETLTNSCFRVMDNQRILTRSVIPESEQAKSKRSIKQKEDQEKEILTGRIIKKGENSFILEPFKKSVRLPFYDVQEITEDMDINNYPKLKGKYAQKLKQAIKYNKIIAEAAILNRKFLIKNYNNKDELINILTGKKPVWVKLNNVDKNGNKVSAYINKQGKLDSEDKAFNPNAAFAVLAQKSEEDTLKAYIKFTGPNMINVIKDVQTDKDDYKSDWDQWVPWEKGALDSKNGPFHNDIELRASQKKDYPRPLIKCIKDSVEYRMQKRCESVFIETDEQKKENEKHIPARVVRQYNEIVKENIENTEKIPNLFKTFRFSEKLSDGDLVYFDIAKEGKTVTSLTPVSISREADGMPMGSRFPDNKKEYNPCTYTCLEDCETCPDRCNNVSDYFKPHPDGLCPACHLFGTPYYKGRVSFGMAWAENKTPKWYMEGDINKGGSLTLPLLEKPRPTWSMPDKKSKIPGRKFYIHHPWSVEKIKESPIEPYEHNRTIEPLGKNNKFNFEIRFDNLRDYELGLLIYSLELENNLAHKIGMAKAHGFGSVKISVNDVYCKDEESFSDKKELVKKGLNYLDIIDIQTDTLKSHANIMQLRQALWFSDKAEMEQIQVCYPDLQEKEVVDHDGKSVNVPGYINFVKQTNDDGKENTRFLKEEKRLEILQNPWGIWFLIE